MGKESYLRLNNYDKFLESLKPKQFSLLHLATAAHRYFYFAEIQVRNFTEYLEINFKPETKNFDYKEVCSSYCLGFYTLIRTSLEASRRLSDEIQKDDASGELKKYRDENLVSIKNIINIANDFIKHPLEDDTRNKVKFYEPGSLDNFGNVGMYEWSIKDVDYFEVPEINPIKDCDTVYKYLEGLALVYLKIIGK